MDPLYKKKYSIIELLAPIDPEGIKVDEIIYYASKFSPSVKIFLAVAKSNMILPQILFNIQYIQTNQNIQIPFLLCCKDEILRAFPSIIDRDKNIFFLKECVHNISQIERNVIFLKGALLQNLYINHTKTYRQMKDIDVLFPKLDSFLNFVFLYARYNLVNKEGEVNIMPVSFSKDGVAKVSPKCINVMHVHIDIPGHHLTKRIDAKYANHLFLPTKLLFKNKIKLHIDNIEYWTVSLEHAFYILIVHIAEHGFIRLSWVNDFYLITTKTELDWNQVLDMLSRDGLLPMFYNLLKYTEKIYSNSDIVDKFRSNYPKYFLKLRKCRTFRFLYNNNPMKPSLFKKFLIQVERIKNRVKHHLTFYILFVFLLSKTFFSYSPRWLKNIHGKIKKLIIIPIQIKLGNSIHPPLFYRIKVLQASLSSRKNTSITITWNRKNGFKIIYPLIELEEL